MKRSTKFTFAAICGISMSFLCIAGRASVNTHSKQRQDRRALLLQYAAEGKFKPFVNIAERGCPLEITDVYGRTPLILAAGAGTNGDAPNLGEFHRVTNHLNYQLYQQIVKYIVSKKVNINTQNKAGKSALMYAIFADNQASAAFLLSHGATIDLQDSIHKTALHYAAKFGRKEIVKMLLDKGGDVQHRDLGGNTVLHDACLCGDPKIVRWVIKAGGNINALNSSKETPLMKAASMGSDEAIAILLQNGAKVNIVDDEGKCAASWAATCNHKNALQLLKSAGASMNSKDAMGLTPLDYMKMH